MKTMDQNQNIVNYHDLKVDIEQKPGVDLLAHLKSNVLGTPGRLRYRHTQTEEKLQHLGETYFLLLRKGKRMLGSVGLCFRETIFSDKSYTSWYVRYFAIKAPLKSSKPLPDKLMERSGLGLSLIRQAAAPYLQNPGVLLKNLPSGTEKSLVYAYIEKENFQSVQFAVQNDFETVRNFTTYLFSRFLPRKNIHVFKIQEHEKEEVRLQLRDFYRDHTLFTEYYLFYMDNYLVYKENGKIVAGMQANPDMWEVKEIGGAVGKFMIHILPYIPGINRFFNPRKLKFVAADYIFWKPGYENAVSKLFETSCKLNKLTVLMAWSDTGSKLINTFDRHIHQGYIGKMNKRFEVDIKVKFNGYEEGEKDVFFRNPAFVSSFDVT
jgi:hypothetical protein